MSCHRPESLREISIASGRQIIASGVAEVGWHGERAGTAAQQLQSAIAELSGKRPIVTVSVVPFEVAEPPGTGQALTQRVLVTVVTEA
jgi:hypothetical protein